MGDITNIGSLRPANNQVDAIGHSKIANMSMIGGVNSQQLHKANVGSLVWAAYRGKQRFDFEPSGNYGLSGDWTDFMNWGGTDRPGILNRLGAALAASSAGTFLLQLATNDRQAWDADRSIANIALIVDAVRRAGRVGVILTDDPRGDSVNTAMRLSSPQLEYSAKVNDYIRSLHGVGRMIAVDTWPMLSNRPSSTGDVIAAAAYDGLHENQHGGMYKGILLDAVLSQLFPSRCVLPAANISVRSSAYNPNGIASLNPYLSGTTGVLPTGATGTLPTGWNMGSTNFTTYGLTVAYAPVTTTTFAGKSYLEMGEGPSKDWIEVTITGTASAAAEIPVLEQQFATLLAGDIVRAAAEIEVDSTDGVTGFGLRYWDSQGGRLSDMYSPSVVAAVKGPAGHAGVLRTPKGMAMGASNRVGIFTNTINGAAVSAKIRIRAIGVGKALAA